MMRALQISALALFSHFVRVQAAALDSFDLIKENGHCRDASNEMFTEVYTDMNFLPPSTEEECANWCLSFRERGFVAMSLDPYYCRCMYSLGTTPDIPAAGFGVWEEINPALYRGSGPVGGVDRMPIANCYKVKNYLGICTNDNSWSITIGGSKVKRCGWVARAASRCDRSGLDDAGLTTVASEACPGACEPSCAPTPKPCNGSDDNTWSYLPQRYWRRGVTGKPKNCQWVAKNLNRCTKKGGDGTRASEACCATCP